MQFTLLAAYCWHLRNAGARYSGVFQFGGSPVAASGMLAFGRQYVEFNKDLIVLDMAMPFTAAQGMVGMSVSRIVKFMPTNVDEIDQAVASLIIEKVQVQVDGKLSFEVSVSHNPLPLFYIAMPWQKSE